MMGPHTFAWAATGELGEEMLSRFMEEMRRGGEVPASSMTLIQKDNEAHRRRTRQRRALRRRRTHRS